MAEKPITQILLELPNGERDSIDRVLPVVYDELRKPANNYLNRERANHTLQPTALVHEVYLRMIGQNKVEWQNRAHFFGISARLMREILIEYARGKNSQKRGGAFKTRIALDDSVNFAGQNELNVVAVDEALTKLEKLDDRQAKIVEMKFFGGLTVEEISEVLSISPSTRQARMGNRQTSSV